MLVCRFVRSRDNEFACNNHEKLLFVQLCVFVVYVRLCVVRQSHLDRRSRALKVIYVLYGI